jgi:hypothetical protein
MVRSADPTKPIPAYAASSIAFSMALEPTTAPRPLSPSKSGSCLCPNHAVTARGFTTPLRIRLARKPEGESP